MRWLALPFALLAATPVAAQDEPEEITAEQLDAEARARFELAMVHIENARFEEAAREFHRAWELSHRDALLYNEALAWRDGGQPRRAAEALAAYLDTLPEDDPGRTNLEARLRTMRAQADALEAADDADEPRPPPEPGTAPHPIGWALLGVGGALAIAGAVTGGVALSISSDLERACAAGRCPEERRGDVEAGPALAIATDILIPVGAAAAVVGFILLFTVTEAQPDVTAGVACDDRGCLGAVGGSF